ncbi:MAG TPA: IS66 family transposase [Kofleriaceae bacterium]|jgi:transposase|nr:IS66 family transposase [Kofleriaceae bacterium]
MDAQLRIAELEAELEAERARSQRLELQIGVLLEQVAVLTAQVAAQTERLGQNSRNSHLPPSSDPPGAGGKGSGPRPKSGRPRGGQRGHRGSRRELVAADKIDDVVDLYPAECQNCWVALPEQPDPDAKRSQWIEVPPLRPYIKETRRHEVTCPCCGHKTRAAYDDQEIPASPFGPRLMSIVALLTGVYHVSRRSAAKLLSDLVGVPISLGAVSAVEARVSEAVEAPVTEAWQRVEGAPIKHTDGTTWLKAGVALALWTIASTAATVFKIVADGSRATLAPLYGTLRGILVSDRATALAFWAMERRQICWAHLLRKYVSFSERAGPAGEIGRQLLDYTGLLFDYWHDYKAGRLDRATFLAWMAPVQAQVEAVLERAVASGIDRFAGSCANILDHRAALWTFVHVDGVEPTNNHAERELRAFVLWRRRCFGTQSDRGNLFAERLMTVGHTARKQHKDVLSFLTACCQAQLDGTRAPSLFAAA